MFEFVPILEGAFFNYTEYLWFLTFIGIWAVAGFWFSLSCIARVISRAKMVTKSEYLSPQPETTAYSSLDSDKSIPDTLEKKEHFRDKLKLAFLKVRERNIWLKLSTFSAWMGWFFIGNIITSFTMYKIYFSTPIAVLFLLSTLSYKYVMQEKKERREIELAHDYTGGDIIYNQDLIAHRKYYKKLLIFIIFISIFLPTFLHGFCVSSFHEYVGPVFGEASISTSILRWFQLNEFCPVGKPCHVYATLPEDTATSVIINAHTNVAYDILTIKYDVELNYIFSKEMRYSVNTTAIEIEGTDKVGERKVHSAYLSNLIPNTMYSIAILYGNETIYETRYKTFPDANSTEPIVIASGGDNGDTELAWNMTLAANGHAPDVFVFGGDIAYDNAMCTCWFAWDYFLKPFEKANEDAKRLIPLVFAVGNHDVGVDSLSGRSVKTTPQGPYYMVYFPQHSPVGPNGTLLARVPTLEERKSYHYHTFGKMLFLALDSGLVTGYVGEQEKWLRNVLETYKDYYKIADYHYPTYSACANLRVYDDAYHYRVKLWNPIFDQYNFIVVFENHEHIFKKTKPLRNGVPDPKGTYFLGNGGWGTWGRDCQLIHENMSHYDSVIRTEHFWIMRYEPSEKKVYYNAYNPVIGELIPGFSQYLPDYDL